MMFDPEGWSRTVEQSLQLFLPERLFLIPSWMPHLSFEDAFRLHESLIQGFHASQGEPKRKSAAAIAGAAVSACWWQRLPIAAAEVRTLLLAHEIDVGPAGRFEAFFDFGMEVAIGVGGRPPLKVKRMAPLSRGRYLTPHQQELTRRISGHDYLYSA